MIEAQSVSGTFGDPSLPRHRRLHLEACRVPSAGAWLTANPVFVDSHVPSPLFRVALQRRLGVALAFLRLCLFVLSCPRFSAIDMWFGSLVVFLHVFHLEEFNS